MDSSSFFPSEELRRNEQAQEQSSEQEKPHEHEVKEFSYRTKTIQFLGRTTPIILQNENGPCPLLAICNVLLLRNNLNLNPDSSDVSQARLLSLVAERLIDSNSNINNKDAVYLENQQQNIADAIDLLPCLATGIDVNIKFRRIDDFEYTRECAIFDLLDIPLYHGWIIDPQDIETAEAIGCKSYNALMGELVALETQNVEAHRKHNQGEDSVDFVAATTAALGVPSPCLSKTRSFDDSPSAAVEHSELRKGDLEEEAEILRALKLSESEMPTSASDSHVATVSGGSACADNSRSSEEDVLDSQDTMNKGHASFENKNFNQPENLTSHDRKASNNSETKQACSKINASEEEFSMCSVSKADGGIDTYELFSKETWEGALEMASSMQLLDKAKDAPIAPDKCPASSDGEKLLDVLQEDEETENPCTRTPTIPKPAEKMCGHDTLEVPWPTKLAENCDSYDRSKHDITDSFTSVDRREPLYEGEECINPGATVHEEREPEYEGEAVLAKKADSDAVDPSKARAKDELTLEQGALIRIFLKNSASQLTLHGLFCLQDGLKERELCVFFRNNHFCTMFKYEGELYLLATDQGYLNQSDLVWEKLNEVNGDTVFMTGNFKEFNMNGNTDGTWSEHNAATSTADYLASFNGASETGFAMNSDLQLAIALQQREFEQQSPRSNTQPPSTSFGASRLVTGPQAPRSSTRPPASSSSRSEGKLSKDKCTVM